MFRARGVGIGGGWGRGPRRAPRRVAFRPEPRVLLPERVALPARGAGLRQAGSRRADFDVRLSTGPRHPRSHAGPVRPEPLPPISSSPSNPEVKSPTDGESRSGFQENESPCCWLRAYPVRASRQLERDFHVQVGDAAFDTFTRILPVKRRGSAAISAPPPEWRREINRIGQAHRTVTSDLSRFIAVSYGTGQLVERFMALDQALGQVHRFPQRLDAPAKVLRPEIGPRPLVADQLARIHAVTEDGALGLRRLKVGGDDRTERVPTRRT